MKAIEQIMATITAIVARNNFRTLDTEEFMTSNLWGNDLFDEADLFWGQGKIEDKLLWALDGACNNEPQSRWTRHGDNVYRFWTEMADRYFSLRTEIDVDLHTTFHETSWRLVWREVVRPLMNKYPFHAKKLFWNWDERSHSEDWEIDAYMTFLALVIKGINPERYLQEQARTKGLARFKSSSFSSLFKDGVDSNSSFVMREELEELKKCSREELLQVMSLGDYYKLRHWMAKYLK